MKNLMPDLTNPLNLPVSEMETQNNTNQLEIPVVEPILNYEEEDETP